MKLEIFVRERETSFPKSSKWKSRFMQQSIHLYRKRLVDALKWKIKIVVKTYNLKKVSLSGQVLDVPLGFKVVVSGSPAELKKEQEKFMDYYVGYIQAEINKKNKGVVRSWFKNMKLSAKTNAVTMYKALGVDIEHRLKKVRGL